MTSIRRQALASLLTADADDKAALAAAIDRHGPVDAQEPIDAPPGIPARAARPELVPHTQIRKPAPTTPQGLAALVHAVAHIELNAIDLATDICWRFAGMPDAFYRDWIQVANEEAKHFQLLRDHLRAMGYDYGSFPAHDTLWQMAERTRHDVLARLALVPRTLEARGLDASPAVRNKLISVGDHRGAEIVALILREEIGHVRIGNRWYLWMCEQRGIADPVDTYFGLADRHGAPKPGAFNTEARLAAGFSAAELERMRARG